jgi:glutamine amidotransferase
MKSEIVIVDYGLGNLLSVEKALIKLGYSVELASTSKIISNAKKIIIPGVGSFAAGMNNLNQLGLVSSIKNSAAEGTPILGICLGMQMLMDESDEFGSVEGLGLIGGQVRKIPNITSSGNLLKLPNIGWLNIHPNEQASSRKSDLLLNIPLRKRFYFLHSYEALLSEENNCIAKSYYGDKLLNAIIRKDNIYGTQFHPEKSGESGLQLLKNFCEL